MEKYKTIEVNEYEQMLEDIARSEAVSLEHYDLLIYGSGGMSREFYSNLGTDPECEVLWSGWSGPKWSVVFSFIPGQAGLIRVLTKRILKELYYDLAAHSVSDIIYVPKTLTTEIKKEVEDRRYRADFEKFIHGAPGSFLLYSEADEFTVENGMCMYYYGYKLSDEISPTLRRIIERTDV